MAAADTPGRITVEIVSPERLLLTRAVDMAVIPGTEGEIGAMSGHAPMIVTLQGGTVWLYDGARVVDRLFVGGGFAEITAERCTVLANEAMPASELSRGNADAALRDAQAAYDGVDKMDMAALDAALDRLQVARARLDAVGAASS